jgi:phosphoribosylaminoimidazole-succinocarboxamide synthase
VYETANALLLVTTDRMSAFDRLLACVPFKGEVLNQTSAYWFSQTQHIVPNHVLAVPHPNVLVARKCVPFKIEFVVRAYLTGTTSTSIWMHYKAGTRNYCGHELPDGEAALLIVNDYRHCLALCTALQAW